MQAMLAGPANLCRPNRDPFWLSQLETTASLASGRSDGSTIGKTINFPKTHAKAISKLLYIKVVEKLPKLLQVLQAVAVVGPFFLEHGKNNPKYPWRADKASLKFPTTWSTFAHMADYMDLDPKRINTLTDVFQSTATHPCKTGLLQHSTLTK